MLCDNKQKNVCECLLSAGPYYLAWTMATFNDMDQEPDGIIQSKCSFNKIDFAYLSTFFNIHLEEGIKDLLDDILDIILSMT